MSYSHSLKNSAVEIGKGHIEEVFVCHTNELELHPEGEWEN